MRTPALSPPPPFSPPSLPFLHTFAFDSPIAQLSINPLLFPLTHATCALGEKNRLARWTEVVDIVIRICLPRVCV